MTRPFGLALCAAGFIMWPLAEAGAGDLPIEVLAEIPLSATVANWGGGLHTWVDGGYQSLDFTLHNPNPIMPAQIVSPTWAPMRTTDPSVPGYGIRGAIGVVIPSSQDVRVQLMTSYVTAAAIGAGGADSTSPALGCGSVANCLAISSASTGYRSWQFELRAATDYYFVSTSFTPSVSLFHRSASSEQLIFEGTAQSIWTDTGARMGLDAFFSLAPHALLGLRGSFAVVNRSVAFASDLYAVADDVPEMMSSAGARRNALLANLEASVVWKPQPWQTFKAYVGVQVDNSSPVAPDVLAAPGDPITFQYLQTIYIGGSLKVTLDGLR